MLPNEFDHELYYNRAFSLYMKLCPQGIEQRGVWGWSSAKIDVKITTQNSHFSKFQYIHLPSCITSIPTLLSTLDTQLSKSVEKNLAYYGLLNFWNKHFMPP